MSIPSELADHVSALTSSVMAMQDHIVDIKKSINNFQNEIRNSLNDIQKKTTLSYQITQRLAEECKVLNANEKSQTRKRLFSSMDSPSSAHPPHTQTLTCASPALPPTPLYKPAVTENKRQRTPEQEMLHNLQQAVKAHRKKEPNSIASDEAIFQPPALSTISIHFCGECAHQGMRKTMEDTSIFYTDDKITLLGVFDGHGGSRVSHFLKEKWTETFLEVLRTRPDKVPEAFQMTCNRLQAEIVRQKMTSGSTATVGYIDKLSGMLYMAALGDSGGTVYRMENGERKAIPVAREYNWKSKREEARAYGELKNCPRFEKLNTEEVETKLAELQKQWAQDRDSSKYRHYPDLNGPNVSRSFGDVAFGSGISQECAVTCLQLKADDYVVFYSDGVGDYVTHSEIIAETNADASEETLAQRIIHHALHVKKSRDNLTAIVLRIGT